MYLTKPILEKYVMVKMDIDDFFMSGDHESLTKESSRLFEDRDWRRLMIETISFLLFHQYIESPLIRGSVFMVKVGSGMGLPSSGAISNACLLQAEREWPLSMEGSIHLKMYGRFKEDIFALIKRIKSEGHKKLKCA